MLEFACQVNRLIGYKLIGSYVGTQHARIIPRSSSFHTQMRTHTHAPRTQSRMNRKRGRNKIAHTTDRGEHERGRQFTDERTDGQTRPPLKKAYQNTL